MEFRNLQNLPLLICCVSVAGCAELPRPKHQRSANSSFNAPPTHPTSASNTPLVNINLATREQLERLPSIGPEFAARIIEHRTRYGVFRRKEDLLIVRGMGERRYRELEKYIVTSEQ